MFKRPIDYSDAIKSLRPNAECGCSISGITDYTEPNNLPQPTQEELDEELNRLKAIYTNQDYMRKRATEYPNWGTQLDYIYHNGIDKWKTDIVDPVKKKYPKPE